MLDALDLSRVKSLIRGKRTFPATVFTDTGSPSPDTDCHQGYATDGTKHYLFHTDRIERRANDAPWTVEATNASPFTSLPAGVTHLGDGCYYNGKLYVAAEQYIHRTASNFETIAVYNATTLAYDSHREVTADGDGIKTFAGLAVDPDNNVLYGISYGNPDRLWKWNATTLAYIGVATLSTKLDLVQGISYNPDDGQFYIASGRGYIATCLPDGTVTGVVVNGNLQNSDGQAWEGLDVTQGDIRWLIDGGSGDRKVHFYTVETDVTVTVNRRGQIQRGNAAPTIAGLSLPGFGKANGLRLGDATDNAVWLYLLNNGAAAFRGVLNISRPGGSSVSSTAIAIIGEDANGQINLTPDSSWAADLIRLGLANGGTRDVALRRLAAASVQLEGATEDSAAALKVSVLRKSAFLPTGALAEAFDRMGALTTNAVGAPTSGQLLCVAIPLPAGLSISSISFMSGGTPLAVGSNQWFALMDSARGVLAKTVDDTSAAWAANTVKTLALSSPPFVTTYTGIYYLGIVVVAGTVPTLTGVSTVDGTISGLAPAICGLSTTGLTNPASLGATAGAFTATSRKPYAYVS